jgi:hypothetical protein
LHCLKVRISLATHQPLDKAPSYRRAAREEKKRHDLIKAAAAQKKELERFPTTKTAILAKFESMKIRIEEEKEAKKKQALEESIRTDTADLQANTPSESIVGDDEGESSSGVRILGRRRWFSRCDDRRRVFLAGSGNQRGL